MNKDWIYSTNIYEVNTRQYTPEGTFHAFSEHLPRLKDMGVHTLWFMPITPIAQKEMKGSMGSPYACSDYTAINPELGTLEDFRNLVSRAHAMGFKVIIDWVANHTGWDHVWTKEHPNWYKKDESTGNFLKASGMDDIIELNYDIAEMRRAMIEAMIYWVKECDIDGFRCDLASWVRLSFWKEAKKALDAVKPLFMLAEADALDHPDYMEVFDAAYSWTWMHRTESFYRERKSVSAYRQLLEQYSKAPGLPAWFTTNHDENTWNGTEYEKYGEAALMLAVFSATWPGLNLVYSGQELPNLKRLKFFDKDPINWKDDLELHRFYKALLHLVREHPAMRADNGADRIYTSADETVLAYARRKGDEEVLVFLNFSERPIKVDVYDRSVAGSYSEVLTGATMNFELSRWIPLVPWGFAVLKK